MIRSARCQSQQKPRGPDATLEPRRSSKARLPHDELSQTDRTFDSKWGCVGPLGKGVWGEGVRSTLVWRSVSVVFTSWSIRSARFADPLKPSGPETNFGPFPATPRGPYDSICGRRCCCGGRPAPAEAILGGCGGLWGQMESSTPSRDSSVAAGHIAHHRAHHFSAMYHRIMRWVAMNATLL